MTTFNVLLPLTGVFLLQWLINKMVNWLHYWTSRLTGRNIAPDISIQYMCLWCRFLFLWGLLVMIDSHYILLRLKVILILFYSRRSLLSFKSLLYLKWICCYLNKIIWTYWRRFYHIIYNTFTLFMCCYISQFMVELDCIWIRNRKALNRVGLKSPVKHVKPPLAFTGIYSGIQQNTLYHNLCINLQRGWWCNGLSVSVFPGIVKTFLESSKMGSHG